MTNIMLSDDRSGVNIDRLAEAFAISRNKLEDRMRLGIITHWYEQGGNDHDKPRTVFRSSNTGFRITLDHVGNIISRTEEVAGNPRSLTVQTENQAFAVEKMRTRPTGYAALDLPDGPVMSKSESAGGAVLNAPT